MCLTMAFTQGRQTEEPINDWSLSILVFALVTFLSSLQRGVRCYVSVCTPLSSVVSLFFGSLELFAPVWSHSCASCTNSSSHTLTHVDTHTHTHTRLRHLSLSSLQSIIPSPSPLYHHYHNNSPLHFCVAFNLLHGDLISFS